MKTALMHQILKNQLPLSVQEGLLEILYQKSNFRTNIESLETMEQNQTSTSASIDLTINDDRINVSIRNSRENVMNSSHSSRSRAQRYPWHHRFLALFPWLEYDEITRTAKCKFAHCKAYYYFQIFIYNRIFTDSFEFSRFNQHAETKIHQKHLRQRQVSQNQKTIQFRPETQLLADGAIWIRIVAAWTLARTNASIHNFDVWVRSILIGHKMPISMRYTDDKSAWEIIEMLGKHLRRLLKKRLRDSPYFGILIDESTDKSSDKQLIIYIKYLSKTAENQVITITEFLDLVSPASGKAEDITV